MSDICDTNGVTVRAANHPLKLSRVELTIQPGFSIEQIFDIVQPDPALRLAAHVYIGDQYIPQDYWARVIPKDGSLVSIRAFVPPGGGQDGKDITRSVLLIAVSAAALAFGGPLAASVGLTGAFGVAVGQAVIGIGGSLLVNALIPPRSTNSDGQKDKSTIFIENARNDANPFGTVPQLFGRMRMTPKLGANSYTEIVGDDQYLNMLLVWGVGPIDIDETSFKIGDTLLSNFTDYKVETREGYPTDTPLTLFPGRVAQQEISVTLTSAGGAVARTGDINGDMISLDFIFPNGLINIADDGTRSNQAVTIEIKYRPTGVGSYLDIPMTDATLTFPSSWTNVSGGAFNRVTFTQKKTNAIRHGIKFKVPTRGQYDVQVRRVTTDSTSANVSDIIVWSALRTITNENPIQSPVPIAVTALRIKATDQLNGIIDTFTGIGTTVCLDWNGSAWVEQPTQNVASLYRYAMQSKALQVPFADSDIDLDQLAYFHDFCAAKGFKYNRWHDFTSPLADVLDDIAAAGRASRSNLDGKWYVVIDEPKTPVTLITPRNSRGFKLAKTFVDKPHALRIQFQNENQDYRTDELRVYLEGYDETNATKFETFEQPGVTNSDLLTLHARFSIATATQRPEQWTFTQDMERLVYRRGDVVRVQHDVLMVGIVAARIHSLTTDGSGNVTAITIDTPVTISDLVDNQYGIVIRTPEGVEQPKRLSFPIAGDYSTLPLTTPIAAIDAPSVGDLIAFGLFGLETDDGLVIEIDPNGDLYDATVTCVPYRESVYSGDGDPIEPFDTKITALDPIPSPTVESVRSDESVLTVGAGESLSVHIAIKFRAIPLANATIDVQIAPATTDEPYKAAQVDSIIGNEVLIGDVRTGEYVNVRLRWIVAGRQPGPWAYVSNHRVVGKSTDPQPLTNLTISSFGGQAFLRWDQPKELDVVFGGRVEFRHSADVSPEWKNSTSIGQSAQARSLFATLPLKAGTYFARVFDEAGNQSTVVSVSTKQASVLAFANVSSIDEAPTFPGTKTDTYVSGISLAIASSYTLVDSVSDFDAGFPDTIDLQASGIAVNYGEYIFSQGFDFVTVKLVRLTVRLLAGNFLVGDNLDSWTMIDDRVDFDGSDAASADCVVYVSLTDDDPASPSATWTEYQRLDSMEVQTRGCRFKAILTSQNTDFNIAVTTLGVDAEQVV